MTMVVRQTVVASLLLAVFRASSLAPPSYTSAWLTLDIEGKEGDREYTLQHMFGELPVKVEIQVDANEGPNKGYYFNGIGSAQTDVSEVDKETGGVVYMYSDTTIIVKCPNLDVGEGKGHVVYTGSSSDWINKNGQKSIRAKFRVRAWRPSDFPSPNYNSGWIPISVLDPTLTQLTVNTPIADIRRKYVIVRVRISDGGQLQGMVCDAQGSSMAHTGGSNWGGVVYRTTGSVFDIWAPGYVSNREQGYGSLCNMNGGWGDKDSGYGNEGEVQIQIFDRLGNEDALSSVTHTLSTSALGSDNGFNYYNSMIADMENDLVDAKVQEQSSSSVGYRLWPTTGGVLFPEAYGTKYGGVVFAYRSTNARVWIPFYEPVFYVDAKWGQETSPVTSTGAELVLKVYKVSQCEEPSNIANAGYTVFGTAPYEYGTAFTYSCNTGFFLTEGQLVLTCGHFGWDGNEPACGITTTTAPTTITTSTTPTTTTPTTTLTTTTASTLTTTSTTTPTTTSTTTTPTKTTPTTTQTTKTSTATRTTTSTTLVTTKTPTTITQTGVFFTSQAPFTDVTVATVSKPNHNLSTIVSTPNTTSSLNVTVISTTVTVQNTSVYSVTTQSTASNVTESECFCFCSDMNTDNASSQSTADNTSSQSTADNTSSQSTADNTSSQSTADNTSSQSTADNTSSQSTADNTSSQSTADNTSSQSTADNASSQSTADNTSSQSTADNTSSQSTADNTSSQSTADNTSSQSTTDRIKALQEYLLVDKRQTSKTKRSKTSADDNRTVSKCMGIIGASLIVAELSILVVIDISNMLKRVHNQINPGFA